jgi:hypothetical protein
MSPQIKDTSVPLPTAIEWCTNWIKTYQKYFPGVKEQDVLRGFTIPIADILQLANEHEQYSAVRAYLAVSDIKDTQTAKILLVPVDGNGHDIPSSKDISITPPPSFIYDFTRPCPAQCDVTSPLFVPIPKAVDTSK